jgi:hypothetical protein
MAESQILGLFASPQMVETAVRQEIRQQAPQFESAPNQRLFNNIAQAGAAFDPRVQRAKQQQEVAQGIQGEFGTSQYYRDLAEQFRQRGMLQSAIVAADKAKQLDKDLMDQAKLKYGAISFVQYGSKVPEIRRLVMQIEMTKDPAAKIALEKELTEVMKQGTQEVADREALEAGQEEAAKQKEQSRFATREDLQGRFEQANSRASAVLGIMKNIGSAVEAGTIYTGPLAKAQSNIMAIAQTFGLTSAETDRMIANTERAESIIGQALLEQIKTLGTNPSNADREFLAKTLPTVLNSPDGIRKIIEYMRLKALSARADAQDRLAYFKTPNKDGSQKFDMLGYESKAFDELQEFFRKNNVSASLNPDDNYIPYEFEVDSKHKGEETTEQPTPATTEQAAEQALTAIDTSPVTQQDSDNIQAVRDQRDQAAQAPVVTPGATVEAGPDGAEPPMPRVAPQTEQGIAQRIQQIDEDLSGASDLTGPDRRALTAERERLAESYNRMGDQRNAVVDAMVLSQMPGSIPDSQKELRLQALPKERKLIIVENMLLMKFNKDGALSPAEQTLYKAIREELRKLGVRQ